MPRPRTPTAILEAKGAFRHNPARALDRADEPRPTSPIGDPPEDFLREHSTTAARRLRIWNELIEVSAPGVLTGCDRVVLANTCRIQAAIEAGDTTPAMFSQLLTHLRDLGMTPASRSKVAGQKKSPDTNNPWAELANGGRADGARPAN